MRIKLWQVAVFAYGILYFLLACAMEAENFQQSYPMVYVLLSMLAQTLVVCGVFLFALDAGAEFARVWRWLFPLLVIEVLVGVGFDATAPAEQNASLGFEWLENALFGLWFMAPAYYFNFRVARYRS